MLSFLLLFITFVKGLSSLKIIDSHCPQLILSGYYNGEKFLGRRRRISIVSVVVVEVAISVDIPHIMRMRPIRRPEAAIDDSVQPVNLSESGDPLYIAVMPSPIKALDFFG